MWTASLSFLVLGFILTQPSLCQPTADLPGAFVNNRRSVQYKRIVAFGDDLTDNAQGSFAHGITGNPTTGAGKNLWGYGTWTDGLVSVSYLAQNLGIPITYDYAFGSSGGAEKVGSICNNTAIPTNTNQAGTHARLLDGQLVPDALSQIANYTKLGKVDSGIDDTLHFFWTGNNDMIASLGWTGRFTICDQDTLCHPGQSQFITGLINCISTSLNNLVDAGARHILVPNVYPRHLSPWQLQYISSDPGMIADFGGVITQTNAQLQQAIRNINTKRGTNIMYFDAYTFLVNALTNPRLVQGAKYPHTCADGCTKQVSANQTNWELYWARKVVGNGTDPFFWMTTVMPSTTVLKALATRMATFLQAVGL